MKADVKKLVKEVLKQAPTGGEKSGQYPIIVKLRSESEGTTKKYSNIISKETTWTALISLGFVGEEELLFRILTNAKTSPINAVMVTEAQPKSHRSKKSDSEYTEGNSRIDIAIGDIAVRPKGNKGDKLQVGIEYSGEKGGSVCFVEAKLDSDIACSTGYRFYRNQLLRIIENLAVFNKKDTNGKVIYPKTIHFALMTPKCFKEKPRTRLYAYLFNLYSTKEGAETLIEDIHEPYPITAKNDDSTEDEHSKSEQGAIDKRIRTIKLHWITHEELIEGIPNKEYRIALINLMKAVDKTKLLIRL